MGIDAVLLMHKSSPTLSYYSSNEHQAEAFTLELGKVEKFGDNKRQDFIKAENVLRCLISNQNILMQQSYPILCRVKKELIRHMKRITCFTYQMILQILRRLKKGTC